MLTKFSLVFGYISGFLLYSTDEKDSVLSSLIILRSFYDFYQNVLKSIFSNASSETKKILDRKIGKGWKQRIQRKSNRNSSQVSLKREIQIKIIHIQKLTTINNLNIKL